MHGKKTWCYPKRITIAKHCNLPVCKISSATTRLVFLGWIKKEGNGGKSCSSLYTFTTPEMLGDTDADQVTVTDLVTITQAVTIDVTDLVIRKKETIKIKNIETVIDDSFEKFWNTFPKKVSKQAAKRTWIELSPDTVLQAQIIDAVVFSSTQNRQWLQDSGRYIPHASTYLSGRRWEDQLPTYHNTFEKNQHRTSPPKNIYTNNQQLNRRDHSAHISSALDALILNEFGNEFGNGLGICYGS